jgi:hypothetical protein
MHVGIYTPSWHQLKNSPMHSRRGVHGGIWAADSAILRQWKWLFGNTRAVLLPQHAKMDVGIVLINSGTSEQ